MGAFLYICIFFKILSICPTCLNASIWIKTMITKINDPKETFRTIDNGAEINLIL